MGFGFALVDDAEETVNCAKRSADVSAEVDAVDGHEMVGTPEVRGGEVLEIGAEGVEEEFIAGEAEDDGGGDGENQDVR